MDSVRGRSNKERRGAKKGKGKCGRGILGGMADTAFARRGTGARRGSGSSSSAGAHRRKEEEEEDDGRAQDVSERREARWKGDGADTSAPHVSG